MKAVCALLVLAAAAPAYGQTFLCSTLDPKEKEVVAGLFARLKPYECCDDTFAHCLAKPNPCPLASRLADAMCRMASFGKPAEAIEDAYARRRKSMAPDAPIVTLAVDERQRAGDENAKVTVVVYACTRCPLCRQLVQALYRQVAEDELKGKARLYLKPFPLKSHPGSVDGALALLAAARQGRYWPYSLYLYDHFDQFQPAVLSDWAQKAGLDKASFESAQHDDKLREELTEATKEGVRHGVDRTPTVFIDGRRWYGEHETSALIDAIQEQVDRVAQKK